MITGLDRVVLGAPGIYELPDEPIRRLTAERMDVCAFVGVAPRGPARVPTFRAPWAPPPAREGAAVTQAVAVPVESWSAYRRCFGGFEAPSRLPYAVAAFFENGGRKAYVVRVVHDDGLGADGGAVAAAPLRHAGAPLLVERTDGSLHELWLRARDEGAWGNRLVATLRFDVRPLDSSPHPSDPHELEVAERSGVHPGTMLRLRTVGGVPAMRRVLQTRDGWHPAVRRRVTWARLDRPVSAGFADAAIVDGVLEVRDGEGREEAFAALGLSSEHPRWIAAVLVQESELVYPWVSESRPERVWYPDGTLGIDPALLVCTTGHFTGGADAFDAVDPEDVFDPHWVLGDEEPGRGVHALVALEDLSLLVVPDLYDPAPLPPRTTSDPVVGSGAFGPCLVRAPDPIEPPVPGLDGLALDPRLDLDRIVELQSRLVALADDLQRFVVLLDVPPRLSPRRLREWRARLASAYAAAYHPWLEVSRAEAGRSARVQVNPSAFAAGIAARLEIAFGVPRGPANAIAIGAVAVADPVDDARHDALHQASINVYRLERDGVRLTGERTLSHDRHDRHLSVRRLMTLIRRALERQLQWAVFEPNGLELREELRGTIEAFLRQLRLANAFAGATEQESFFVRCDDELNPRGSMDQGRLVAQVGIAPAEPLEFIVLQIAREGDGTLRVRE